MYVCCTFLRVAVSRSKDVPPFGPNIPAGAKFGKQKAFADFLLTKGKDFGFWFILHVVEEVSIEKTLQIKNGAINLQ